MRKEGRMNIGDPIFIGDFWGLVLALPISLFLAYWLSAVKNHFAVISGAFIGALLAFFIILAWAGPLITNKPLLGANGGAVFFGSVLLCTILGLSGGILIDLLLANRHGEDYRRQAAHEE
jgi:hypothetical protein